jgi:hypothetical protein
MEVTVEQKLNHLLDKKKKLDNEIEKLTKIKNSCCIICCDQITYEYEFQCCDNIICSKCIFDHIKTIIDDIQVKAIKCPFCNIIMQYNKVYQVCRKNKDSNYSKKYKDTFQQLIKYKNAKDIIKFDKILNKDKIYGKCIDCPILVGIKKECANADGNIIVLRKEMFICEPCTTKRFKSKPYEDLPYKKCPHCGILGKPNPGQCNYLYCNDHRWCYICQARLPLDNFGHNHHYWIGKGSSPYDFNCRVFSNNNQPTYIMEKCDCSYCQPREGKAICMDENCSNLTDMFKCEECS